MVTDSGSGQGWSSHSDTAPTPMARHLLIRKMLRAGEVCATVVALFVISRAVLPLLLWGSAELARDTEPPVLIERLPYWLIYAFTTLQCVLRPRQLLRALAENPFVAAVVAIALLSTSWSVDPGTLRRAFQLGMSTLFGLYLASRYRSRELLRQLAIVLGVSAVLSVLFSLMLPEYGLAPNEVAWQGVFTHKNTLGQAMLLATIVFTVAAERGNGFRFLAWVGTALAIALIVLSRSMTAMLALGALAVATPLARLLRQGRAKSFVLLLAVCCALSVALLVVVRDRQLVLSALGRDVTLTGRTALWGEVIQRIADRPLLGYGYGAFWVSGAGPAEALRAAIGWDTPHSHNGFLDFSLDLGLLGLSVLATGLALAVRRAWKRWSRDPSAEALWPLVFLVTTILIDLTESPLYQGGLVWPLFVFAATVRAKPAFVGAISSTGLIDS